MIHFSSVRNTPSGAFFFIFPLFFAVFLFFEPLRVPAQAADPVPSETPGAALNPAFFPLIPLLEAAFGGELRWRPDWPVDFPTDGFSISPPGRGARGESFSLLISNETESFSFRRDGAGRLTEFPCFLPEGHLRVKAVYDGSGAMLGMSVGAVVPAAPGGDESGPADGEAPDDTAVQTWEVEFPPDFLPYGVSSPGGTFPPVRVSLDDAVFAVVLHESPAFFSETWYDAEGTLLAFHRFTIRAENGSWRVQSLQTWDGDGARSGEYAFDGGGNITEVNSPGGRFSALYRDRRPRYWERRPAAPSGEDRQDTARFALQWDERGLLRGLRSDPPEGAFPAAEAAPPLEYRYEYGLDAAGNWIKRQDFAVINTFGVFVSRPGRIWTRYISFTED
jgi:hypothetical protein